MGEWSDYFEDFPEENPANWVGGQFDPKAAAQQRETEKHSEKVAMESRALQRKMFEMAAEAKRAAAERSKQSDATNGNNQKP